MSKQKMRTQGRLACGPQCGMKVARNGGLLGAVDRGAVLGAVAGRRRWSTWGWARRLQVASISRPRHWREGLVSH